MSQQVEDEGNNLKRKLSTDSDVPNGCPLNNAGNETETNTDEHFEADDETDHLRQFDVLDEVQGDDSGSENGDNELKGNTILLTLGKWIFKLTWFYHAEIDSSDSEVEEIDIDNLLDEGLPDDLRERKKTHNYEEKSKLVLEGIVLSFAFRVEILWSFSQYYSVIHSIMHCFCRKG